MTAGGQRHLTTPSSVPRGADTRRQSKEKTIHRRRSGNAFRSGCATIGGRPPARFWVGKTALFTWLQRASRRSARAEYGDTPRVRNVLDRTNDAYTLTIFLDRIPTEAGIEHLRGVIRAATGWAEPKRGPDDVSIMCMDF